MATIDQRTDYEALIVVRVVNTESSDKDWCCNNIYEARSLVKWLRGLGLKAVRITQNDALDD